MSRRIPGANTGSFDELAGRLTERDFAIIAALAKHKIMTAGMLEALFFPSSHAAAARLLTLSEMGVLARWRNPSSRAFRYVLDWRGQCLQAMRDDEKPPTKSAATFRAQQLFVSAHRAHTEGVNAFYCRLMRAARDRGDVEVDWVFEHDSTYSMRSDANVTLTWADGRELWFWFEHDRGTETLQRLAEKVKSYKSHVNYHHLKKAVLLIEVPGPGRLANLLPLAAAHWRDSTAPGTRPTPFTVAASAATAAEQTFTRPETFPDTLEDRRWHVVGTGEVVSLAELPQVAKAIANRPVIWD
ncbi:replication-relaxation family protein [Glycomyces buryatensis]|nr:replication-relaxation family protein [Glycomyces buryatensis]